MALPAPRTSMTFTRKSRCELTGRWVTLAQIVQETGLKKVQVHGAMLGKDGPYVYERRLADESMPNGPKEYRLKGT